MYLHIIKGLLQSDTNLNDLVKLHSIWIIIIACNVVTRAIFALQIVNLTNLVLLFQLLMHS